MVVRTEFGERVPVAQALLGGVADAVALLQRRAREPDAAEALLGERAHVVLDVAVEQQYAPTPLQKFDGRGDARDAGADDDHVGLIAEHGSTLAQVPGCSVTGTSTVPPSRRTDSRTVSPTL